LAGTLICAALLLREAALAASQTVVWSAPRWWHDLLTAPAGLAALAGVAAALLGVGCLWLALRMLGGGERDEGAAIDAGAGQTSVVVKAGALERLLARRLVTRTSISLAATDVRRAHARARTVIDRELRAAAGLDAGELTVEVDELLVGRGGGT
jgi:hypothetical protein